MCQGQLQMRDAGREVIQEAAHRGRQITLPGGDQFTVPMLNASAQWYESQRKVVPPKFPAKIGLDPTKPLMPLLLLLHCAGFLGSHYS
jgi:hypothetical protein